MATDGPCELISKTVFAGSREARWATAQRNQQKGPTKRLQHGAAKNDEVVTAQGLGRDNLIGATVQRNQQKESPPNL